MATKYPEHQIPDLRQAVSLAISSAGTVAAHDICDCKGHNLTAVSLSTVWTSAVMSFRAGPTTTHMAPLFTSTGAEFTVNCTSSQMYYIDPNVFRGMRFVQPIAGNSTTIVAQTTATTVYFHLAPLHPLPR